MKRHHLQHKPRPRVNATAVTVNEDEGLRLISGDPDEIAMLMDAVCAIETHKGCDCDGLFLAIDPRLREYKYTVWVYHSHGCPRLSNART